MLASSVGAGLVVGLLFRGDPRRLADLRIRWWPAFIAAVGLRALAAVPVGAELQRGVYLAGLWLLLAVAAANLALPGVIAIAAGIALNAAVITLNGGAMPVGSEAAAAVGFSPSADPLHREMDGATRLPLLGDLIPFPLGGVYSVGDVVLSMGVFALIVRTMKGL